MVFWPGYWASLKGTLFESWLSVYFDHDNRGLERLKSLSSLSPVAQQGINFLECMDATDNNYWGNLFKDADQKG
jgi:hypothetical protein